MEYSIVRRQHAQTLEEAVNRLLKQGWQLQGGASVVHLGDGSYIFIQAMIRIKS